ncbi:MAG: hypothetical protein JRD71_06685 [Deltaproteobacteria bacterium]|nr:hypothetical protein [Deltaproteobacteria bacterium]
MRIDLEAIKNKILAFLLNPKVINLGKKLILSIGILFYIIVAINLVVFPLLNRTEPVEIDDAYTYIIKAVEMEECFFQKCPALEDLRLQLSETFENPENEWLRYREYGRAFTVFHPLHSLIMVGFHSLGLSWEIAFELIVIIGGLGIILIIAYWLYNLFGPGPTGIALFLLAFTLFPSKGVSYIVPSTLSLGIALFAWGKLLNKPVGSDWVVLISTLALVTMHPMGKLYAFLTVLLYLFLNKTGLTSKVWLFSGISVLIIAIFFILPMIVKYPDLSIIADPTPAEWESWTGYSRNIIEASSTIKAWLNSFGGIALVSLLIVIGLLSLSPTQQRSKVLAVLILLGGLLSVSLLHVLPRYPADTFNRVWVPFGILITGIIAQGIWQFMIAFIHWVHRIVKADLPDFRSKYSVLSLEGWGLVIIISIGLVLSQVIISRTLVGRSEVINKVQTLIDRGNWLLDPSQPEALLSSGCGTVLYMAEVPMHYYFTHGALACGAVYYPALANTSIEIPWVQDNPDLDFVVAWNPVVTGGGPLTFKQGEVGGPLTLTQGDQLDFHLPQHLSIKTIYLHLENTGNLANIDVSVLKAEEGGGQEVFEIIQLPAAWAGWIMIDIGVDGNQHDFYLDAKNVNASVILRGIKFDKNRELNWPWDEGMILVYQPINRDKQSLTVDFDITDLIPLDDRSFEVINDFGDTILIKLK